MEIQNMLRASHTMRWSLVNTSRQQTVAEHSFNVAMIAAEIAKAMDYKIGTIQEIMMQAITHDIAECITGDLPTPTKHRIKEQYPDLIDDIESEAMGVDFSIGANDDGLYNQNCKSLHYDIVKFADLIDAIWFIHENGVGRHAGKVGCRISNEFQIKLESKIPPKLKKAAWHIHVKLMEGELML